MKRRRLTLSALALALVAGALTVLASQAADAATLPTGFQEQVVFTGLTQPTNIEFAPDGRIFVAEKRGTIKVFDNLADTTPTVFADLSSKVENQNDRGLLGMALAPNFPANPWVYVLYSYDAPPGQTAPVWNDACPDANSGTCVITGQLSRLQAAGNVMTGTEQVLIHDWCQQFASHSIGDLHFGQDGALYVTGGDGASYNNVDYGQYNGNPCGDPDREGGALRSQDSLASADPTGLNGTLLRLDPNTGEAMAGNPNIGSADLNTRRIVAQGLRNPFRFTFRPGTNEPWISDVGWNTWEEVNRVVNPTAGVTNFGWPCYEGNNQQGGYAGTNPALSICSGLFAGSGQTQPYFTWNHGSKVVANEACPSGSSSAAASTFYPTSGGTYPAGYQGALFFSDYSRSCIWAMKPATPGGLPSPANLETFASGAASIVDLTVGPGSELYYADLGGGTIRRLRYFPSNQPPVATIGATPTSGGSPLTVAFDGTGSTDADPADLGRLTYQWDFTNDGVVDSTAAKPSFTYTNPGSYTAKLTVTDTLGASASATVPIAAGNDAPTAVMDTPVVGLTWKTGDIISFAGHATDPQQGTLPASALTWDLRMQHCQTLDNCHTHYLNTWTGVASGSFPAPDHEYPSYMELVLTATDAGGLTSQLVRRLDPQTVNLTFTTTPPGLQLAVGSTAQTTPFTRTVIVNSTNSVSAPSPQTLGGTSYSFASWSDGGAPSHSVIGPATASTYTATFTANQAPPAVTGTVTLGGLPAAGASVTLNPGARTTVADAAGHYAFTAVTAGAYTLNATLASSRCAVATTVNVTVSAAIDVPIALTSRTDPFGYTCADGPATYVAAGTALALTGDDALQQISTPFAVKLYGSAYSTAWVDTNGQVSFVDPGGASDSFGVHIPAAAAPNAVVRPFFDDLLIDGSASVRTATIGSAPNRQFVVEWRNATFYQNSSRVTAEVIFAEATGAISFVYATPSSGARANGSAAVIGIENSTGSVGFEYAFKVASATPGRGVTFTPPSLGGSLTGHVKQVGSGLPVAGAVVTLNSGVSATTAADGSYSFAALPVGAYTVTANVASPCATGTTSASVTVDGPKVVELTVPYTVVADGFGYTCAEGSGGYVAAGTVLALTGDDALQQISTPFAVKLYGSTYSTAWVETNGQVSFVNPGAASEAFGIHIPTTAGPNAVVKPFFDDLLIDGSASVRTATIGSAPNRQFVVEWRNATFYLNSSRVTVEVIFSESTGAISFVYGSPSSGNRANGSTAVIGIENSTGTVGFEYSYLLPKAILGRSVTFTPPA